MTNVKRTAMNVAVLGEFCPNSSKEATILATLRSGKSLNRFDAERLGDHCLHSTVATLRSKGNAIYDEWERVPTRFGREARVKRYRYIGKE